MSFLPPDPDVAPSERATAPISLRFEDVSQDGCLLIEALPQALGSVVWGRLLTRLPFLTATMQGGVIPILSRSAAETFGGPISLAGPIEAEGRYQFAHTVGPDGAVDRVLLNMWARVTGVAGRTYGAPPPNSGEKILVGRVFSEHVFTRPFAPPGQRKVLSIDVDSDVDGDAGARPSVSGTLWTWTPPAAILALPEGASAIDAELVVDPMPICFGLDHTDGNHHVNSLVYPRLFIEAALRRLSGLGRETSLLARAAEIAFRKPCFAGERMRIALRAFELRDRVGIVGVLVSEEEARGPLAVAKPRCFVRLLLGR